MYIYIYIYIHVYTHIHTCIYTCECIANASHGTQARRLVKLSEFKSIRWNRKFTYMYTTPTHTCTPHPVIHVHHTLYLRACMCTYTRHLHVHHTYTYMYTIPAPTCTPHPVQYVYRDSCQPYFG